ncbi:hypothetical protein B0A78_11495 [Flavobacterium columnare NBRC 100251 = ATCC 23463]|uniref:hypothetical protein n=1 Tax=Flavobacterium TaxID=237 RepID=UPI0007C1F6AC|nr:MULTISPECIES: hypothetical protein [Flavobacterium]AND64192.1 hypothetical protein AX766_07085 [Flavobacterium covae]PDS22620.1 hypothetical protein B0A78_11495 [Flavobacterium columnare NBRC 100251 = ATCC 23463]GEM59280.1 hypothetical protein FC1_25180 [Flavobacterium columnare NBRC 100251 = ATCC 23463]
MVKYFYTISLVFLLISCNSDTVHQIYFDVEKQVLYSCNESPLKNISIESDSISKEGFPINESMMLVWNNNQKSPPLEISFKKIPVYYTYTKGGIKRNIKYFNLKPNCSYFIEKWGGGKKSFIVKIWTDSLRNIYKTTHKDCGSKSTLGNIEAPAPQ